MKILFCDTFSETWKYNTKDCTGRRKQQPSFVQDFDYCKRQYFAEVLQKLYENNRQ
jgi:hypothetical protein